MEGNKIMNEPSHSATVVSTYNKTQTFLHSTIQRLTSEPDIKPLYHRQCNCDLQCLE